MRTTDHDRRQTLADRLKITMGPLREPLSSRLRASPDRSNVRVLIAVGVAALLVAAGYLLLARPRPQPAPQPVARASLSRDPSSTTTVTPVAASGVVVHVLGKVRRPGVITLPSGSRVAEAIKAAGGVRPGAGTGALNLARKVVDGEQIPVGIRPPPGGGPPSPAGAFPSGAAPPGTAPPGGAAGATPLDLNTATVAQLDQLPGVGPVLAQRILDYRTQNGGFRSVEQLQEVTGIGARRFADLKPMVRV
ncbi:ComEA family DNA-binding protein [Actinomadura graeca]|uniref:ComEA family DNA-binding protein n=1 Tax=Actinomadura graeca TaxID=2750812 RepID=A0ABX8R1T8_9ACTN|nr:ComEA family DNA-binding protein [Actinomadura graeca]QXJ25051.1 ComEA family DNA-binding protein [Actinomadura graeca]